MIRWSEIEVDASHDAWATPERFCLFSTVTPPDLNDHVDPAENPCNHDIHACRAPAHGVTRAVGLLADPTGGSKRGCPLPKRGLSECGAATASEARD
ncbi:hypothetical protein [Micromonospora musae]|uniref:hypothetical protein n=1 Tax=Micromonospora musae TaxID=1894970 RepID=UPI0033D6E9CB